MTNNPTPTHGRPIPRPGFFLFRCYRPHRDLHSFPTRRSSDLTAARDARVDTLVPLITWNDLRYSLAPNNTSLARDRKSTRLNSSHPSISYAVFCLKKKTNLPTAPHPASQAPHGAAGQETPRPK